MATNVLRDDADNAELGLRILGSRAYAEGRGGAAWGEIIDPLTKAASGWFEAIKVMQQEFRPDPNQRPPQPAPG